MKKKVEIKKVTASIREVSIPQYEASFRCPYCHHLQYEDDVEDENVTIIKGCDNCDKKFKVKIPKFY